MVLSIFIFIAVCYLVLIITLIYGWKQVPEFTTEHFEPKTGFSIIVPFRNEAENLPDLLESLSKLKYPASQFEILLINDASEDISVKICSEFQLEHQNLKVSILDNELLSKSPKKDALKRGIENGNFRHIVTTDADCVVPESWLQTFNDFILKTDADMVCAPVCFRTSEEKKLFQKFEELDFMSLQATTVGAFGMEQPFMCNGANLCYKKEAFLAAEGFSGNDKIASGDDVFLLQKFQKKGLKVEFLKSEKAIVATKPQQTLPQLISQRVRWAAKAPAYKSTFSKFAGLSVLLMNVLLIIAAFLVLFEQLPEQPILVIFLLKFNADFILIFLAAKFFKKELLMRNYFWCSIVYPFFSGFVALKSLFSGFEWKGRKFRS
ncbi:glycosyltransferase family 2 protein [Autumnicola psychrophila]|uniref:Glycosyltransferase n=1 Tax=Autumnicola psychrophila TaxID=3075592 RepID=A0ABU3DWS4_9FLAO|nr:glycosyltransferase [Zunongwangia sp. F225]MDT0688093.1 glycosyltransferase [Zunongwangia sp. F225]